MKKPIHAFILLTLTASLLSSCMLFSKSSSSWSNPEFEGREIGKTAIIAKGESEFRINQFESMLVDQLAKNGVSAQSFRRLYPRMDEMDEEELTALIKTNQYTSIIVAQTLSAEERGEFIVTGYTAAPDMGQYRGGFWGYGMSYTLSPDFAQVEKTMAYEVEINLFDVESEHLVWSGRKGIYDGHSQTKNLQNISDYVVKSLHSKKMF